MDIYSAIKCDIGKLRENNEDNFYFNGKTLPDIETDYSTFIEDDCNDPLQFYAVFDGMGGEEYGEIASSVSANKMCKYQQMMREKKYHSFDKYIDMYISEVNAEICEERKKHNGCRIGTTIAFFAREDDKIHILNIGDSRIYMLRNKKMLQLTEDHTPAVRAYQMGNISKDDIKKHPHRNKLTQYLGIAPEEMIVKPYRTEINPKNKDRFLICSDGLTDMVSDEYIKKHLKSAETPKDAVNKLFEAAMANGGRDNITIIVLEIRKKDGFFIFK